MYDLHALCRQFETSPLLDCQHRLIGCFYQKLHRLNREDDPLFGLWGQELSLIYGAPDSHPYTAQIFQRYGLKPEGSLWELLQSIQTFYSVLVKFIAYDAAAELAGASREKADLREILSGSGFRALGVENYCYEDWFCWILKYWDEEMESNCHQLRNVLKETEICSTDVSAALRGDSWKRLYETVIPVELRHALGEYYTPDWLASWAVDRILETKGTGAWRWMDPTCGSGAFLACVLKRNCQEETHEAVGFDINRGELNRLVCKLYRIPLESGGEL